MTPRVAIAAFIALLVVAVLWFYFQSTAVDIGDSHAIPPDTEPGAAVLAVDARVLAAPTDLARPPPNEAPPPLDLTKVDRDLDLFGIVTGVDTHPIPGATVQALRYPGRRVSTLDLSTYGEFVLGPATVTGTDGTFAMRLRRGDLVNLQVTKERYAETTISRCQAGERVVIELAPSSTLDVRVTGPSGSRAADTRARIWFRDPTNSRAESFAERCGVTDSSGSVVFPDLQAGLGTLAVEHDRWGDPGWMTFELLPGET
ncbi:MAG: hypothetical protein KDC38_21195, partial [Planctomycetes bacterium]|nr:hypothetical protein [Planctomycetota bacterium]